MDELFKIHKLTIDDVKKIAESPNEPHIHDFEELLIGVEGSLEHFIDFEAATCKAPYISFVTKGKLHRLKPTIYNNACSLWQIRFNSDFIPETTFRLYSFYHDHANIELRDGDCFNRMDTLCAMMFGEMKQAKPSLAVVHDLLKTLFTMIESENEKLIGTVQPIPKTYNTTFINFLKILEENFRRAEGVDFYAEKLFMSARNLNMICQNILHKTASEILETRKLIEAKNLLIYSDEPVSEIGFELGFNEKAYFTSVFKKRTGQTPSYFREAMRSLVS